MALNLSQKTSDAANRRQRKRFETSNYVNPRRAAPKH